MTESIQSVSGPVKKGPTLFLKQFIGVALILVSLFGLFVLRTKSQVDLPVYFTVPEWIMINQNSQPMGSTHLQGKVYLANFIFSRCPSVCPKMLLETKGIQRKLDGKVQLISFTVDPDFDKPAVLYKLARQYEAQSQSWNFLTSENREAMFNLFRDGFRVSVSEGKPASDLFDIAHSEKMVLVDQKGQIRGYYGYEAESIQAAVNDALSLAEQNL